MARKWSRRAVVRWGVLAASVGLSGCTGVLGGPDPEEQVREHEETLQRFTDVGTALSEGYRTAGRYVRTDEGVLGIPFVNREVEKLDPENPQAVLYGLTEDGQYEALGLKWFVAAEGRDGPPTLFGKEFVGPRTGETALLPEHYALHVWLFQDNPDGLFALYNPTIEPSALVDQIAPVRERLVDLQLGSEAEGQGYRNTEKCITTDDGGYGVPFVKENDRKGGTDPADPPVLIYRLTRNWSYRLMGAEWYVPAAEASGPPSLFGRGFHGPMDGHSSETDQPEHYGLHAWLFGANPRGMFAPFNPTVVC